MRGDFWSKVDKNGPNGCWLWLACLSHGYGVVRINKKGVPAHRRAYELMKGEVPNGLVLDHICMNPPCVNPDHLEPVTQFENMRRWSAAVRKASHCRHGHEFTEANTYNTPTGGRHCKACRKASLEALYERRRISNG